MAQIIFHGGCVSCLSQETMGKQRCLGCACFECNWDLPDLSLSECELEMLAKESARREIKGLQDFSDEEREAYLREIKEENNRRNERRMEAWYSVSKFKFKKDTILDKIYYFFRGLQCR